MKPKAIIYSRVSTHIQDNISQIEDLKAYANYKKYEVIQVYEDKISGTVKATNRIGFQQLLLFIETNNIEHVLIWELSRLGRNLYDVVTNVKLLTEKGINIYSKKESLNTLNEDKTINPHSQLSLNIMSSVAEFEINSINERTKRGRQYHKKQGGGIGTQPYGYTTKDTKIVIDEKESIIVKQIYDLYLNGTSSTVISKHLNNTNVATKRGGKWGGNMVRRILQNPIYYGDKTYEFGIVKVPSIITKSTYLQVQEVFKNNTNYNTDKSNYFNPLKGLIKCGVCGSNYRMNTRKNKVEFTYICSSKDNALNGRIKKKCINNGIHIDWLNSMVFKTLKQNFTHLQTTNQLNKYENQIKSKSNNELSKLKIEIKFIEKEIVKNSTKLNRMTKLLISGSLSETDYLENKYTIENELETLNKQLNEKLINQSKIKESKSKIKKGISPLYNKKDTYIDNVNTFIKDITIHIGSINECKELTTKINPKHYQRLTKVVVHTIFNNEYVFYTVKGFSKNNTYYLVEGKHPRKINKHLLIQQKE